METRTLTLQPEVVQFQRGSRPVPANSYVELIPHTLCR